MCIYPEINEHQAAQINEFMSEKSKRDRGRGGRAGGRQSVHNRLGNRPGLGPQPGQGVMLGNEQMRMMNPRFQMPPGPRGLGMPRRLLGPRHLLRGPRQQMPMRGPVMGGPFNSMFAGARLPQGGDRFPIRPMGPQGNMPMMGPGALLEPMKQLLQRMRGPHPGGPRMNGPGMLPRPDGLMGIPMAGPGPRLFAQNRMLRPPQQLLSPNRGGPMLMGPGGIQTSPNMPSPLRQVRTAGAFSVISNFIHTSFALHI
ncbi:hypothetical protein ElyMa_003742600 [Elysia marginata]|uniref:Uncharacterized protein n=1 Tax=Elysia marginata TaxID=1093978 RepID=A0AAV4F6Z4_9GAST|nr:hypothetical protein ElyMa_003742600 [Elysia marginata]